MAPNPETIDYENTPLATYAIVPPSPLVIIDAVYAEHNNGRTAPIGNDGIAQSVVTNVENFEAMAQAEMSDRVASFSPAMASEYSVAWTQFSRSIESASEALSSERAASGADGFEGELAEKVRETHESFVNASTGLSEVVGSPSGKLDNFGGTLGLVQTTLTMVPLGGALTTAPGAFSRPDPRAVAMMETVYSPAVMHAGDRLPALPGPIDLAFGGGSSGGGGGGVPGADGSPSDSSASDSSASDGSASDGSAPAGLPSAGSPQGVDGSADEGGTVSGEGGSLPAPGGPNGENGAESSGGSPVGRAGDDAAISQAGLAGGADGGPSTGAGGQSGRGAAPAGMGAGGAGVGGGGVGGAGVGGAGGLATGPVPMSGSGGGGSGGASTGGRGAPSQGSVGGPAGSAKGALPRGPGMGIGGGGGGEPGMNNAMSGRRGMGGGMMGGPGAGRGRGEEDDGYTPAEFLTTIDNGDKLIGPLPRVVHPVIGAWN